MSLITRPDGVFTATILIGICVYILVIVARYVWWFHQWKTFFNNLPGYSVEQKHWFKGHLLLFIKDRSVNIEAVEDLVKRYPRFFRVWIGSFKPTIYLVHPETAKIILKTADPKPMGFTGIYRSLLPWLGEGLLLAGGEKWAYSRRLLTPAFHFDILKPYQDIFNQCTDIMLDIIDRHAESGESFELFNLMSNLTLDIILQCAFSYKTNCQYERNQHSYCKAVTKVAQLAIIRNFYISYAFSTVWNKSKDGKAFNTACDLIHDVADKVIMNRKRALNEGQDKKKRLIDFVDILLTAKDDVGMGMSPEDIRAEVDTFLFAGHDTTTSAMTWILYELAKQPDYMMQCQEEIDIVLKDSHGVVKWDSLEKLEFLTQCIKEGMRLHSPVPIIGRQASRPYTIDGVTFPAKTYFSVQVYALHHNPTVWHEPHIYDPNRFSKNRREAIEPFAFIPFSAGPRNCIGHHFAMNEVKTVIARVLERFTLEIDPNHKVERRMALVMRAKNGVKFFAKRKDRLLQ